MEANYIGAILGIYIYWETVVPLSVQPIESMMVTLEVGVKGGGALFQVPLHSLPQNYTPPVIASITVIPEAPPVSELWSDADQAAMVATYLCDVLQHPSPDDIVRRLV